jgi:hypothetical protein
MAAEPGRRLYVLRLVVDSAARRYWSISSVLRRHWAKPGPEKDQESDRTGELTNGNRSGTSRAAGRSSSLQPHDSLELRGSIPNPRGAPELACLQRSMPAKPPSADVPRSPSPERVQAAIGVWRESADPGDAGAPIGLILSACRLDSVVVLDTLDPSEITAEWQLGEAWRTAAGYRTFVLLRRPTAGKRYAFLRVRGTASPA